jgi:hypothetical protein
MTFESDLIRRYRGAFSRDECKEIIEYINFFEDNQILEYDKSALELEDHKVVNVTHDYDLGASSKLATMLFPGFKPCVTEYLESISILRSKKFLLHDLKLKKIPAGGGFHNWHYENGSLSVATRQFVVQLYLNDDFDGGETEFLYQQRREESVAGDIIIFPASYTHTHRGNPPLGGDKYIATSWGVIQQDESDF